MAMPQCCYLAKGAKRPSHTTNTIKFDRIPFDPCNSIKRFDLSPFDQKNSTYLQPPTKNVFDPKASIKFDHIPLDPCNSIKWFDLCPFDQKNSTYLQPPVPILPREQEQRPSGNADREATVVGAGPCDGEGELAYTVYDLILSEGKYLIYFKRFAGAKTGYGTFCRNTICGT